MRDQAGPSTIECEEMGEVPLYTGILYESLTFYTLLLYHGDPPSKFSVTCQTENGGIRHY